MGLIIQSLSDKIYEILRKDIITQKIACGEKLNIRELQDRFAISSTPIREALNRLQQEGLVDYATNVGAKVIEIDKKDIVEINRLCKVLDCGAIELAMESGNIEEIAKELKAHIASQERAFKEKNEEEYTFHADQCHEVFYKYANNQRLSSMAHQIQGQFNILNARYKLHFQQEGIKEHKLICEEVQKKNTAGAVRYMEEHYEHSLELLLSCW